MHHHIIRDHSHCSSDAECQQDEKWNELHPPLSDLAQSVFMQVRRNPSTSLCTT